MGFTIPLWLGKAHIFIQAFPMNSFRQSILLYAYPESSYGI